MKPQKDLHNVRRNISARVPSDGEGGATSAALPAQGIAAEADPCIASRARLCSPAREGAEAAGPGLFHPPRGEEIRQTPEQQRILATAASYGKWFSGASSKLLQQEEGNF